MISEHRRLYEADVGQKLTLQKWCKAYGLYYSGVVRFLKGEDCTVETYFRILAAADPDNYNKCRHYLARRILYSDLAALPKFLKDINIL